MRLRPKVSSPLSVPPATHHCSPSGPVLMASPGTGPRVPAATCLECRSCGQGADGFRHRLLLHSTHHVQRPWLRWPAAQLPVRVSVLTHTLCPPHSSSGSLLPSPFPSPTLWWCLSLPLLSCTRGSSFCCSLCLLYVCFSSVSLSQSQAPFISASRSLSPWVSWPLSPSPTTSSRAVVFKP